ncbi:MAG: HTH domain-containing protein [Bacteroidetes bacterium]|nr:HTH domain-containing protein [Bacteroidota bacterium]
MKFDEYLEKLNKLQKLVNISNTGSPKDLAKKLDVSERTARRMVQKLRHHKLPVVFNRKINSYEIKN